MTYKATFIVKDAEGAGVVADVKVYEYIEPTEEVLEPSYEGKPTVDPDALENGKYHFIVTAANYEIAEDDFVIADTDKELTVTLTLKAEQPVEEQKDEEPVENTRNGGDAPGIRVSDGFYQDAATYTDSKNFYITSKDGLEYFRNLVSACDNGAAMTSYLNSGFYPGQTMPGVYTNNIFSGKTVHLNADINLNNEDWTPIGYVNTAFNSGSSKTHFYGSFDGHNHTISNIKVASSSNNSKGEYGFFGRLGAPAGQTISNLTLSNVTVSSGSYVGALIGNAGTNEITINNVDLSGTIDLRGDFTGGLCGIGRANVQNCDVTGGSDSKISGNSFAGGLVGAMRNGETLEVGNNTVNSVVVASSQYAGGLVGAMAVGASGSIAFNGNTIRDNTLQSTYLANGVICTNADSNVTSTEASTTAANNTIPITGIKVTGDIDSLFAGETLQLTASKVPANATEALGTVTWATSNADVATVDASGLVTAVAAGTATITASANNSSGVTTTCEVTVSAEVAQIDTTKYATFAEAWTAANTNGGTLKLLENVNVTAQIEVSGTFTLDLNGKKIEYTGNTTLPSGVIMVLRGANLTIADSSNTSTGKIKSGTNAYAAVALTKDGETSTANAVLTVNGGTLEGNYYAITGNGSRHGTAITINGGVITGTCANDNLGIYHPQDGTLTITGGTITGYSSAVELRSGTLNITGGTLRATATTYSCNPNDSGTTTVGAAVAIAQHTTNKPINASITGGTLVVPENSDAVRLSVSNPQNNAFSNVLVSSNIIPDAKVPEGYTWQKGANNTYTLTKAVATVTSNGTTTSYTTLAAAVEAAQNGDTVTLLDNVALTAYVELAANKALTVDLNGKTISSTSGGFDVYGTLTITDTSANADGKISVARQGVYVNDGGSLIMNAGTIDNAATFYGIRSEANTSVTISGGKIEGSGNGIFNEGTLTFSSGSITVAGDGIVNAGTVTMSGGTIDATRFGVDNKGTFTLNSGAVAGDNGGIFAHGSSTTTINGGTVSSEDGFAISTNGTGDSTNPNYSFNAVINIVGGSVTSTSEVAVYLPAGTLNVTDGTISGATGIFVRGGTLNIPNNSNAVIAGTGAQAAPGYAPATGDGASATGEALTIVASGYPAGLSASNITVAGGTFNSTSAAAIGSYAQTDAQTPVTGFVSGGTFSSAVPEECCANGYIPTDNGSGIYGVGGPYEAKIGTTGYATLAAAIDAAQAGDTVTLLDNVTSDSRFSITKSLTIDGQGHTIAVNNNDNRVIDISGTSNVTLTLKNVTIDGSNVKVDSAYPRGISLYGNTNVKLVLDNATVSAGHYAINVAGDNNGVDIEIKNSSVASGWAALNVWSPSTITVTGSELSGTNNKTFDGDGWNNFSTVVLNDGAQGSSLSFTNTKITSAMSTGNSQWFVDVRSGSATITFTDCDFEQTGTPTNDGKHPDAMFAVRGNGISAVTFTDCDFKKDNVSVDDTEALFEKTRFYSYPALYSNYVIDDVQYVVGTDGNVLRAEPDTVTRDEDYNVIAGTFYPYSDPTATLAEGYIAIHNANGTYTVGGPYVATLTHEGTVTGYASLKAAVTDAADGDTITLLADANGEGLFIGPNKFTSSGLTIDFGGYTYTVETPVGSSKTVNQMLHFEEGNKITLTNGSIVVTDDSSKLADFDMIMQNYCTLVIDTMTIDGTGIAVKTYSNSYSAPWSGSAKPQFNYNTAGSSVIRNSTITVTGDVSIDDAAALTIEDDAVINANAIVTKGTDERYDSATATVSVQNGAKFKLTDNIGAAAFDALLAKNGQSLGTAVSGVYTVETLKVAQIGDEKYETLAAAFAAAADGDTITLLADVALTERLFVNAGATPTIVSNRYASTTENKSLTLDLNNHSITSSSSNIALAGGSLNITGTGTISTSASGLAPIEIRGTGDLTNKRTLTIGQNVTLTGSEYGLNVFGSNDALKNTIDVTVNGTVNGMLFVLGNLKNTSNSINIVVNGTVDASEVTGTDEAVHTGIAICGNAAVTVNNGAVVKGESGIEVRAGSLTVNGGTITATASTYSYVANGSGTTTKGAAIAVAQHSTLLETNVTLNGGTLTGVKQIGVTDVNNNMTNVSVVAKQSFIESSDIPEGYEWVETSTTGVYTLAKKAVEVAGLKATGASLGLEGWVIVRIWTKPVDGSSVDYVTLTLNGRSRKVKYAQPDITSETGERIFNMPVYAKEMGDDVVLKAYDVHDNQLKILLNNGTTADQYTYTVDTYTANAPANAKYKQLVNAMSVYGDYAEYYFKNPISNTSMTGGKLTAISANTLDNYKAVTSGSLGDVAFAGGALALEEGTYIRVFFSGNVDGYIFRFNNKELTPVAYGSLHYVTIDNVAAKELDTMYTVEVTDGTNTYSVQYSALTYVRSVLSNNSNPQTLKDVVTALYWYNHEANEYFD